LLTSKESRERIYEISGNTPRGRRGGAGDRALATTPALHSTQGLFSLIGQAVKSIIVLSAYDGFELSALTFELLYSAIRNLKSAMVVGVLNTLKRLDKANEL
jgi:hypothetical protein